MSRIRYGYKGRYKKLENGDFVPEEKPESVAQRLSRTTSSISYHVREWTLFSEVAGFDPTKDRKRWEIYEDEAGKVRLRCFLENDRRTLWSLRENGIEAIGGDFDLTVRPINESEMAGYIRHSPTEETSDESADDDTSDDEASDDEPEVSESGTLSGQLAIPEDRFNWIIEKLLRAPDARLIISLTIPLYKEAIAHSFDEYWMRQDFMIPFDEVTEIGAYEISVAHGPGLTRLLSDLPDGASGNPLPEENEDMRQIQASPDFGPRDKRLDYILYLLIALVVIALIR